MVSRVFLGNNGVMKSQSGNAFVITLLSIVLLGALTFVLSRQMGGTAMQSTSAEQEDLYANGLISTASQYEAVISQMLQTGATIDTLNFALPSDSDYTTGNTLLKVYHPAGGGMTPPKPIPAGMSDGRGNEFFLVTDNADWVAPSKNFTVFAVSSLSESVCQKLNKIITGSTAIPEIAGDAVSDFKSGGNGSLNAARCPGCEGKRMACVLFPDDNGQHLFYAIVAAP